MNKMYLVVYLLLIGAYVFFMTDLFFETDQVEFVEQNRMPTPDELWEKQQQKKVNAVLETQVLEHEKTKLPVTKQEIDLVSMPDKVLQDIPTPDELWEQQHQENRENDLPATIPDIPVISEEQRESEALAKLPGEQTDITTNKEALLELDISYQELPASHNFLDAEPFELRESERKAIIGITTRTDDMYEEPLLGPSTGLSDDELMNMGDVERASSQKWLLCCSTTGCV